MKQFKYLHKAQNSTLETVRNHKIQIKRDQRKDFLEENSNQIIDMKI